MNSRRDAGVLFVAARGNDANDNDARPLFPASREHGNVVSASAADRTDANASFSRFGGTPVKLGAPGSARCSRAGTAPSAIAAQPASEIAAETLWTDEILPTGAEPGTAGGDERTWFGTNPAPGPDTPAHLSAPAAGMHRRYFTKARETLSVYVDDTRFAWV